METVLLIVSVLLIMIVLLQGGKADLFSNRKERGGELFISRLTMILGILFFCICLFSSFLQK